VSALVVFGGGEEIPDYLEVMLKAYTYAKCGTCRKAVKFLRERGIDFVEIPIRETPPSLAELKEMLAAYGGNIRKIFNTSGQDYKALGLSAKLPALSEAEALKLLASNGNLVKRPFVISGATRMVGFDESGWKKFL
jgi:arsenate reductase (glutaredoxin)